MARAFLLWAFALAGHAAAETEFIDNVMKFCYERLLEEPTCCKDSRRGSGVQGKDIQRPGASWECINPPDGFCLDSHTGKRGQDRLWWTEGADCSAPRILYVHGGNWTFHGPTQSSYDILASKIATVTNAVVLVPDFRLVPIGNYSDIVLSLMDAWRWLGTHGPDGNDCSAAPAVPQFLGGDSSGAASALSLLIELERGMRSAREGFGPPCAGFFGFSPWTNLACDTPTYLSEAFASIKDLDGRIDLIGDLLHPRGPRTKSRDFRELGRAYVNSAGLLEDPVASPFHAAEEHLRGLPPLYFAISETESMAGDSVVMATKAANFGVPVALDVFPGMWHIFPQYSEGCGSGKELWQGMVALMHTADFVRQIFAAAKNHPGRGFFVEEGSGPQMEFLYPHPEGKNPWSTVVPLRLFMGVDTSSNAANPQESALVLPPTGVTGQDAVEGTHYHPHLTRFPGVRRLREEASRCTGADMASAFFNGILSGSVAMTLGLAVAWLYTSRKHGLCIRIAKDEPDNRSIAQSPGQESKGPNARYQPLPTAAERRQGNMDRKTLQSVRAGTKGPFWMRPGTAVRREIRSLPIQEQERFVKAVQRLMCNKDGKPQSSEYFRLASCHGWPYGLGPRCAETFPAWNRGHLVEFERALAKADKELGHDGSLALPYWDFTRPSKGKAEVIPQVLRDRFQSLPDGLLDQDRAALLGGVGYKLYKDQEVERLLEASGVASAAAQAVGTDVHWLMASRGWRGRGSSLESVHDSVLSACGFPLSDAEYGAFHPLFFLIRCNLDRLYELHLQMFDHVACCSDLQHHQRQLHEVGHGPDLFLRPLDPLKHPFDRRPLMAVDTFTSQDMGYVYDELPNEPAVDHLRSDRREEPVYALFTLSANSLRGKSYMLHVFLMPKKQLETWKPPVGGPSAWMKDKHFAGCTGVLCRRGPDGAAAPELEVQLEVQQALTRQKLSRHDAGVRVLCVDQLGEAYRAEEAHIPQPKLVGPLFEEPSGILRHGTQGGDVKMLQERLERLGYSPGETNGDFGSGTEQAVRLFQKVYMLPEDGMVNKSLKQTLGRQRLSLHSDFQECPVPRRLVPGNTLRYLVRSLPFNLEQMRDGTTGEIFHAFSQWGEALGVTFTPAESSWRVDVTVQFADLSARGAEYHGGLAARGGQLAEVSEGKITLDSGEYWLLQRQEVPLRRPHAVHLYPVLLHAIGHYVGLPHSSSSQDVMWPFYRRDDAPQVLSPNDVHLAQERQPEGGSCQHQ